MVTRTWSVDHLETERLRREIHKERKKLQLPPLSEAEEQQEVARRRKARAANLSGLTSGSTATRPVQPSLFDTVEPTHETRRAAAANAATKAITWRERCYRVVESRGTHGCTCDEASIALDRPPHAISGLFGDLRKEGRIVPTKRTRKTRLNASAVVMVAAQFAESGARGVQ